MALTTVLAALLCISFTNAATSNVMPHGKSHIHKISVPRLAVTSPNGTALPNITTVHYFNQLIDHDNPGHGTFRQRFWINWEFYKPHGPIVLLAPELRNAANGTGQLTNESIAGMIAQQQQGATVKLEHRFFGDSNPYDNLTSQSLELLMVEQSINDIVYFAQNVDLPMPGGGHVKPDTTPWVLAGAGYSGTLASWTMVSNPGVFRAGYASSAPVQLMTDFYSYFTPIREYMPRNCSSDVQVVISFLDEIYAKNDAAAMQNLKDTFGLGGLSHFKDFAAALRYNLFDWQKISPSDGPGGMFFKFCDALEVKDGASAPSSGWGLEHSIDAWGSFWNTTYYSYLCGVQDAETCLGTYNTSQELGTDVRVDNLHRSWKWLACNQLGLYQSGPPEGQPAIVSRILQPIYEERQCVNLFPDRFSSPPSPSTAELNSLYGGWNLSVDRLFFANGRRDPWRDATVSADGLNKANTTMQPIYESDGSLGSDWYMQNGVVDETVRAVQTAALEHMKIWLA